MGRDFYFLNRSFCKQQKCALWVILLSLLLSYPATACNTKLFAALLETPRTFITEASRRVVEETRRMGRKTFLISGDPIIIGSGIRPGSNKIKLEDIAEDFNLTTSEIKGLKRRTGVEVLYRFSPWETFEEVGADAIKEALVNAGSELSDVSGIFSSTASPTSQWVMPSPARMIGKILGLENIIMTNVGVGCAGGLQALQAAYNQLKTDTRNGKISTYVVVSGDTTSTVLDPTDRATAFLFSEGVAALVVTNRRVKDGYAIKNINVIAVEGDIYAMKIGNATTNPDNAQFRMDGENIITFANKQAGPAIPGLLKPYRISRDDLIIPHNGSRSVLRQIALSLDLSEDRIYFDGLKYGNMTGASWMFSFNDALETMSVHTKQRLVLAAFGADRQVGAAYLVPRGNPFKIVGHVDP